MSYFRGRFKEVGMRIREIADNPSQSKVYGLLIERGAFDLESGLTNSDFVVEFGFSKSSCSQILKKCYFW